MRLRRSLAAIALFAAIANAAPAGGPVPAPKDVLGHDLGARYTSFEGISKYLDALAPAAPDRMKVVQYGTTYEGRALRLAVLASPANLARLDAIRADSRNLADPRALSGTQAAELVTAAMTVATMVVLAPVMAAMPNATLAASRPAACGVDRLASRPRPSPRHSPRGSSSNG